METKKAQRFTLIIARYQTNKQYRTMKTFASKKNENSENTKLERVECRRNFIKQGAALLGAGALIMAEGPLSMIYAKEKRIKNANNIVSNNKINIVNNFDTVITNGLIYNGERTLPYSGNIGIKDGKIKDIWTDGADNDLYCNAKIINANGLVVCPGFIDIHTHTDTNLLEAPLGDSRIFEGITTDIGGNCGDSPFPYSDENYMANKSNLRFGFPYWKDIDGFYDSLRKKGIGINYKSYTGQGQLRSAVVGNNNVECTKEQLKKMCNILSFEMEAGSVGLSCGLEYAPGSYASDTEIAELCKVVAKYNGLFAIHMRNEDDRVEEAVAEAIKIAQASGVRLQISHLKAQNAANWHKAEALIRQIEKAESEGVNIAFDRYPYIAFSTGLTSFIPLNDRQGTTSDIIARLKNPIKEKEIGKYALSRIERLGGSKNVLIAACDNEKNKIFAGKNIEECCKISGLDTWPQIRELLISEDLKVQIVGFAMKEENVQLFLSHKLGMPASDGSVYSPCGQLGKEMPHPRSYGTFPRFLGKYVREDKICNLQTAIHKCTALPASQLGLKNRGLLKIGYGADIVIFNDKTILDTATFSHPHQFPIGIEHVIVNGSHTIAHAKVNDKLNGIIL